MLTTILDAIYREFLRTSLFRLEDRRGLIAPSQSLGRPLVRV